jgi:hypothetical protein
VSAVAIHENYKDYTPPPWVKPAVERLLASLAPEHIAGLESIVLTDAASIGKGRTHRVGKRKYRRSECRGFYNPRTRTSAAWIQLVVDNVIAGWDTWMPRFLRDAIISRTLYHEVGHHLEHTVGAATRRGEAAAEDWRRRLARIHFGRRYPILSLLVRLLRWMGIRKRPGNLTDSRS